MEVDEEAEDGLDLMLALDEAKREISNSDLSEDSKFLLTWIVDGLLGGGDPLLGLLPRTAIRKGITLFKNLRIAFAYESRCRRGEKSEVALRETIEITGKSRATIFAAVRTFTRQSGEGLTADKS
jgi:hypothetical protein